MSDELDRTIAATVGKAKPADNVVPFKDGDDGDGGGPTAGEPPPIRADGLPEGLPILPLGTDGRVFYYFARGQIQPLPDREHGRNALAGLISPQTSLLEAFWPRRKKMPDGSWKTTGFAPELMANSLMDACARRGIWKEHDRLRGPGGWRDDEGNLIFHCGDRLWQLVDGTPSESKCGDKDGYVYSEDAPIIVPYDDPIPGDEDNPIQELVDFLNTWKFQRGTLDVRLMLGLIGAGMIAGALDWRPMGFLTGDMATGKSTLQKLIQYLNGKGGIVHASNTTAAGLYQHIKHSSLPVAVDELEAQADNSKVTDVLKLARHSSSGSVTLRGGSNHSPVQFSSHSVFLFAAVIPPPFESMDQRRMAVFRLDPLAHPAPDGTGGVPTVLLGREWARDMGRKIKRRLADQWSRYPVVEEAYRDMLTRAGHDAGGCDQFGTLMAVAEIMLNDHLPSRRMLDHWQGLMKVDELSETSSIVSNASQCLDWLKQSQPESFKSGRRMCVSELVAEILEKADLQGRLPTKTVETEALAAGGLAVTVQKKTGGRYLAVPYVHRQVAAMFAGTTWAGAPGTSGGWAEALPRLEGVLRNRSARIGGDVRKCMLVPIELVAQEPDAFSEAVEDLKS